MNSQLISVRLDMDGKAGRVFMKWLESGYKKRQIVESALLSLDGQPPKVVHDMSDAVLNALAGAVDKLERIVSSIEQNGGVMTSEHRQEVRSALSPELVENMQKIVRPGFAQKPGGED